MELHKIWSTAGAAPARRWLARIARIAVVAMLGAYAGVGALAPAAHASTSHQTGDNGAVPFGGDPFTNQGSAPAQSGAGAATAPAAQSTINVHANQPNGTISPAVMGSAYLPPFGGMGSLDPTTDRFWPSFIGDLQTKVYTGSLRWPGGITSQYYDWRRAVGPQSRRTDNPFGPSTGPSPSTDGPDEFGQLLGLTGAQGVSTVNFATGDPQEAAEFVQYMTGQLGSSYWANLRALHGHPLPYNVPVWEVGNEEYTTASSWRSGTVVSVGGAGACTSDAATCQYIYGGSDSFSNQPVVGYADRTAAAADSTGGGDQSFYVAYPPIQSGSQTIDVGGQPWSEVSSLAGAGPVTMSTRSMTPPERSISATARTAQFRPAVPRSRRAMSQGRIQASSTSTPP